MKKYSCRDFHRWTNVWDDFSVKNNYTSGENKNQPLKTLSTAGKAQRLFVSITGIPYIKPMHQMTPSAVKVTRVSMVTP